MSLSLLAPLSGTITELRHVQDPVFAQEIVGPGIAIKPDDSDMVDVVSPVSGTVLKQLNHAVVIRSDQGPAVLIHLGLDTHRLDPGRSVFNVHDGNRVEQGDVLLKWDLSVLINNAMDTTVPVIIMDPPNPTLNTSLTEGEHVHVGDILLVI